MKYVIFDFDGTLADSMPVMIEIANGLLAKDISKQDVERYRNMTIKQILKEANIPLYKVPGLLVKGKPLLQKRMHEVEIFSGLDNVINDLAKSGHKLYVVSSNSAGIINGFLDTYKLKKRFTRIYGNIGIFSKAQALKKVMKREGFTAADAIYIGDEVRDIEAAKKVGMPIISVTWGYNGKKLLTSYKPDYMADKPIEITKIVNEQ